MTKEALKKEAIQYAVDYPTSYGKGYKHKDLRIAYLAGAEPREKQIAELGERCIQLQKDKGNLTDRVRELEAQIEKMNELINRYYEVCVQIPKELRTMVFDSCLEDTRKMVKEKEIKEND